MKIMPQPDTKRLKRRLRKRRQKVEEFTDEASRQLEKHVFKKIDNSVNIAWRFIASWLLLLIVLVGGVAIQARALGRYYLGPEPAPGGEYVEGIEGALSNANPIFAASNTDTAVSRLLFGGLLKYDNNGKLVGDLAESWVVDPAGTTYTIKLRPNVKWHDGEKVTSADVVFTIQAIQNPDTKSPYNLSWQGVVATAPDPSTVVLTLSNPLTSFAYSLTQGIIPKHRLGAVPFAQLRSNEFSSRQPIGTGPFVWGGVINLETVGDIQRQRIAFRANEDYHLGAPKISRYIIETYPAQADIVNALKAGRINSATLASLDDVSESELRELNVFNVPLMSGVYIFFNNSRVPLNDKTVRQALVRGIDTKALRAQLGYPVIAVDEPFLKDHVTYDPARKQAAVNRTEAAALLDKAGWAKTEGSFIRSKDQKSLEFVLLTEENSDYARLADALQRQLVDIGVKLTVTVKGGREFQQALLSHDYDALLYDVSIGEDPDVFAYWHSTQATIERFNFSEYKSGTADEALSGGRTREGDDLRIVKYRPFLDAWRDDAPAVGVYQPRLLFVANGQLYGFEVKRVTSAADRYADIHNWMFNTEDVLLRSEKR